MRAPLNAPPWMQIAFADVGVNETDTPSVIFDYARDAFIGGYRSVKTPWCSVANCAWFERIGIRSPRSAAARSWLKWGQKIDTPRLGAVAVLRRGREAWQGHVGQYVADCGDFIKLLSGNTGDSVCVKLFPKGDVIEYRWPTDNFPKASISVEDRHERPTPDYNDPETARTAPPVVREEPPEPAPVAEEVITHQEVRDKLKTSGSRTLHGVDRIVGYIRSALASIGIYTASDAAGVTDNSKTAWIVLMFVLGSVAMAILYEVYGIEEARVDDELNGQKKRTKT